MRKDILERRMARLTAKREELKNKALASADAEEVRSINALLEDLNADIADVQDELDALAEETRSAAEQPVEQRSEIPADAAKVNGSIVGAFTQKADANQKREETNMFDTMEYRQAFMGYVQKGSPMVVRGEVISTTDTAPAIPLTIMNRVINTVRKRYGNLYAKVRKAKVKGGVEYPIGALKATFKWITEATVSPRQKLDALAKVSFQYHVAEIRIAQSFLSQILTIDDFEAQIAEVIAIAYLEAMDYAIVNGSGNGQPLGILNDSRVPVANVVTMSAADLNNWTKWRKNFFAKLPLGYRDGEFIFPVSTVDSYLETMADANNNPIFRQATGLEVNDGDARNPSGRFFGRDISLVEPEILPDFDTASSNDVIGIFWQPQEYAINENFGFTMRRYFDEETNEWVDKALVVVDGKLLNPMGVWLIKKA